MIITLQKMAISFLKNMGTKVKRRKLRKEQKPYICPTFIILLYKILAYKMHQTD